MDRVEAKADRKPPLAHAAWILRRAALALATPALVAAAALVRRIFSPAGGRRAGAPRIAVIAYEHQLGSTVAVTPIFPALRTALPDAEIVVFGTQRLEEALRFAPDIDRIVTTADPHDHPLRALFDIVAVQARHVAAPFDWLLTTAGSRRGLVGLMAATIPASRRAGHDLGDFVDRYAHPVAYDNGASVIANNLRILAPFMDAGAGGEPSVYFDAEVMRRVRALLADRDVDPDRGLAVFALDTSGGLPTQWFADRAANVADRLAERFGLQIVLVGTGAGRATIEATLSHMTATGVSLAGCTTVPELAALFAMADVAVALDTGAMHVARSTGVPLVVVAAAFDRPVTWLPIGVEQARVVSRHDRPGLCCGGRGCVTRACMAGITADEVFAAAAELLQHHPPSAEARRRRCVARTRDNGSETR